MKICPYLGLKSDPTTALHFASVGNYCHHVNPIEVVKEGHQVAYCLAAEHVNCPVYQMPAGSRMPRKIRANAAARERKPLRIGTVPAVILLVVLLAGAFVLLQIYGPGGMFNPSASPQATQTTDAVVAADTVTPEPSKEAFRPFCQPPPSWKPYTVQTTDTFAGLALTYGRPMNQLMAANCRTDANDLLVGERIYLPELPTPTFTATSTVTPTRTKTPRILYTRPPNLLPTWTGTFEIVRWTPTFTPTNTPTDTPTPAPTAEPTLPPGP